MSGRLAQRYWTSLIQARPEARERLIEHGRRRDLPLWRRYLAALLDFEPAGPDDRRAPAKARGTEPVANERPPAQGEEAATSGQHYTLDLPIALTAAAQRVAYAPAQAARRGPVGALVLAAVLAVATVLGVSVWASGGGATQPLPIVVGASPSPTLPERARKESGGFAWVVPDGWRRDVKTGTEVHYTSPDGTQELAAKSTLDRGDLLAIWRTSERNAAQGERYRKIQLKATTFRDYPAVVWEYTFQLDGVPWHARLLGFNAGGKSYQVNTWYRPAVETEALAVYREATDTFVAIVPETSPPDTAQPSGRPSVEPSVQPEE
ncbi:hypothetical protein [Streptomyces sp. NPDC098781]|uniref:hypothetical protein n=1 Tax=Streptomyces sp. NPDC098781 TaxID=3366097 RepID=UPI00380C9F8A